VEIHQPGEKGEALRETSSTIATPQILPLAHESPGLAPRSQWLALVTMPRHEKQVARQLAPMGVECFLPLFRTLRRWNDGSKINLELPLFPGYIFVRISKPERVPVLKLPGALKFVAGVRNEPAPLPDAEIDSLRLGLEQRRPEPYSLLASGRRARIRCGALAGMEGVVVRWKGSLRVVLTLNLVLRSVAVEVNGDELEPIGPEPADLTRN
jgi:transcription antitermination factor NusG